MAVVKVTVSSRYLGMSGRSIVRHGRMQACAGGQDRGKVCARGAWQAVRFRVSPPSTGRC